MVLFNYSTRELTAKIVYYGPGLCGKTTNLQFIFDNLPGSVKGKMLSLATKTDRTLFFDFLPLDLGEIRGMKTRIQLYTVPGQVFYNETRRLVLKGADGVVFVADSQKPMIEANIDSYKNLDENLRVHSMRLAEMPLVVQYNKRDLANVAPIDELNSAVNFHGSPFYESVATTGIGVQDTLKAITKLVLLHLTKKYDGRRAPGEAARSSVLVSTPMAAAGGIGGAVVAPPPAVVQEMRAAPPAQIEPVDVEEEVIELDEPLQEDLEPAATTMGADEEMEEPIELEEEFEEPTTMVASGLNPAIAARETELDDLEEEDPATVSMRFDPAPRLGSSVKPRPVGGNGDGATTDGSRTVAATGTAVLVGRSTAGIEDAEEAAEIPEVPRLVVGQDKEIAVPVDIEADGIVRRFTLSIRIRLSESTRSR